MTVQEAKEELGFRQEDTIVKSGLEPYRKAYKNIIKDASTPSHLKKVYERSLEAVETLLKSE